MIIHLIIFVTYLFHSFFILYRDLDFFINYFKIQILLKMLIFLFYLLSINFKAFINQFLIIYICLLTFLNFSNIQFIIIDILNF